MCLAPRNQQTIAHQQHTTSHCSSPPQTYHGKSAIVYHKLVSMHHHLLPTMHHELGNKQTYKQDYKPPTHPLCEKQMLTTGHMNMTTHSNDSQLQRQCQQTSGTLPGWCMLLTRALEALTHHALLILSNHYVAVLTRCMVPMQTHDASPMLSCCAQRHLIMLLQR